MMNDDIEQTDEQDDGTDVAQEWADFEAQAAQESISDEAEGEILDAREEDSALSDEALFSAEGTELEGFESAEVEDAEFIEDDRVLSIVESLLFSSDRPMSVAFMKQAFKGTNIKAKQIRRALDLLAVEYASVNRGVTLEEINGGFQLRTKVDNMSYLRRLAKSRPFKLSGPALEVMAIVAYKQPLPKAEIDSIRGVESGHLLRGLMEKGLVNFAGKSDLPGKPMLYATTRKFLEIFGLRNIRELPSLSEIDELIPEGIGEEVVQKEVLGDLTEGMSMQAGISYSEGEEELLKISSELETIATSSEFFEDEKRRQREKRDRERAEDIRDAVTMGETVDPKDLKWLGRYEKALAGEAVGDDEAAIASETSAQAGEPAAAEMSEVTAANLPPEPEAAPS